MLKRTDRILFNALAQIALVATAAITAITAITATSTPSFADVDTAAESMDPSTAIMVDDTYNNNLPLSSRARITEDYGLRTTRTFAIQCPQININYQCMKDRGRELIVFDPGHNDTAGSARSEDHTLDSSDPNYRKARLHINEGRLNMVTAWLTKELLVQCNPDLDQEGRNALMAAIKLARFPGERLFGIYQNQGPRRTRIGGTITTSIQNRAEFVHKLITKHRKYDGNHPEGLSGTIYNMSSKAIFISGHADNLTWTTPSGEKRGYNFTDRSITFIPRHIPINGTSQTEALARLINANLARYGSQYIQPFPPESDDVLDLKIGAAPSFTLENIRVAHHPSNLKMLSSSFGSSGTIKLLIEGFAMTGRAGGLASLEIQRRIEENQPHTIEFVRNDRSIDTYKVSDLYIAYAKAMATGLDQYFGCD